jgi:hypothetical protein
MCNTVLYVQHHADFWFPKISKHCSYNNKTEHKRDEYRRTHIILVHASSCMIYSSTIKMEAKYFFETSIEFQRTTSSYITEYISS